LHHSSPWAFQKILGFGFKLSGMENVAKDTGSHPQLTQPYWGKRKRRGKRNEKQLQMAAKTAIKGSGECHR
jgi:hypothetical protein